jgi:TonB family protein
MFTVLLESNPRLARRPAVTVASAAMHAGLLLLAAWATAQSGISPPASPREESIPDIMPHTIPAPVDPAPPSRSSNGNQLPRLVPDAPRVPLVGLNIPDALPAAEESLGDPLASLAAGDRGSIIGIATGGSGLVPGSVLDNRIAEKPALPLESNAPPLYPDILRSAAIEGEVEVEFVIGPDGAVRAGSVVALRADHRLFLEAVRDALIGYRYLPAEVGGIPVAVRVRQSFSFKLNR